MSVSKCAILRLFQLAVSLFAATLILGAPPQPASAQQEPTKSKEDLTKEQKDNFVEFIKAGKKAYSNGEFEKAIPFFEHAYDIIPRSALHYRIALCHERAGHPEKAVVFYEKFLKEKPETSKRGQIEKTISRLEEQIEESSVATVNVESQPSGAKVFVKAPGSESRESTARGETPIELELKPGDIELTLEKEGFEEIERSIDVKAGENYNYSYDLPKAEPEEKAQESSQDALGRPTASRRKPRPEKPKKKSESGGSPVAALVIGGVGAVAGGTFYGIGMHCDSNRSDCKRNLYNTAAIGAYAGAALGIGGLTAATVIWMSRGGEQRADKSSSPRAPLQVVVSPTGFGISGRF